MRAYRPVRVAVFWFLRDQRLCGLFHQTGRVTACFSDCRNLAECTFNFYTLPGSTDTSYGMNISQLPISEVHPDAVCHKILQVLEFLLMLRSLVFFDEFFSWKLTGYKLKIGMTNNFNSLLVRLATETMLVSIVVHATRTLIHCLGVEVCCWLKVDNLRKHKWKWNCCYTSDQIPALSVNIFTPVLCIPQAVYCPTNLLNCHGGRTFNLSERGYWFDPKT